MGDGPVVTVAVAQFAAGTDKPANLAAMAGLLDAATGADLVVFPEYSMFATRSLDERTRGSAEPLDGPFGTAVGELAVAAGTHVLYGTTEAIDGAVANTLVLRGPDGAVRGRYRKVHLFDAFGAAESDWLTAGDPAQLLTFPLGGLTFGALTCYDLRFPELARLLVDAGAQALLVPAQWLPGPHKESQWRALCAARAIENTAYLAAAGQCAPAGAGNSMVIDPMGVSVAGLAEVPGLARAELSAARVDQVRQRVPSLRHRRYRVVPR